MILSKEGAFCFAGHHPISSFNQQPLPMESIEIAIAKFKVEPDTAMVLRQHFEPFQAQAIEWADKAKDLIVTDETQTDRMASAKEARLAMRKIRLSIEALHKELKEDSLKKGQLLDLIKRTLIGFIEPTEELLQKQEDFIKIRDEQKRRELRDARLKAIREYSNDYESIPVEDLTDIAFNTIIIGLKAAKEQREIEQIEIKKQQEENERLASEAKTQLKKQNDQMIIYNERVQRLTSIGFKWSETSTGYNHEGIQYGLFKEKIIKMRSDEFDALFVDLDKMVTKYNATEQRKKEASEAKLKKERTERIRLENEVKAKLEKEESERKQKAADERKAKRAPDREKLLSFAAQIELLEPPTLKDDESKAILLNAQDLLAKVVKYVKDKTDKL
jgi:hypothetical protein